MTWPDFRDGDPGRWIAVLPVAAVEQHGPHLPLGVDGHIAQLYLDRVLKLLPADLPVTFLPLQWIGKSDEHRDYPGTLSFSSETLLRAWTELGESVHRAGVRKLVLVNAHGGNSSLIELVARDLRSHQGMFVVAAAWHRFGYPPDLFPADELSHGIHAGAVETSLMLAARQDLVRRDKIDNFPPATVGMEKEFSRLRAYKPTSFGWMTQDFHPSGALGDARAGGEKQGQAAVDFGARAFVELLQDVHRFDLARLKAGPLG